MGINLLDSEGRKPLLIVFCFYKIMKNLLKKIREKWKEINTEGYEGKISIELSIEQIFLIVFVILFLLWIILK